jgi:hypothetical protein
MNLSKEVTMLVLEKLIKDYGNSTDKFSRTKIYLEILCFQNHLKGFEK